MANKVWNPASNDLNVAGNWLASGVPADEDFLHFNDVASFPMIANVTGAPVNAKDFSCVVERGFVQHIGQLGTPFTPANIRTLIFEGIGNNNSNYFSSGTAILRAFINTTSQKDDIVVLSGSVAKVEVANGKAAIASGATLTSYAGTISPSGGGQSQLTINSGVTTSGLTVHCDGGMVICSSTVPNVVVTDGVFVLAGSAGVTGTVLVKGGVFYWDAADASSPSTIALAEVHGGAFRTRTNRIGRTLTDAYSYGSGLLDFSVGGLNITFTAPPRACGENAVKFPRGATATVGF